MEWMKQLKVVIFDLDGTLYQDYRFLNTYLRKIFTRVNSHNTVEVEQIIQESYSLIQGDNEVRLGFLYDQQCCLIAHNQLQPTVAYNAKYEQLPSYENNGDLVYIGDPWSIVTYIAKREKIDPEVVKEAFNETRLEMLTGEEKITKNTELIKILAELPLFKVLMTNTALPSGEEFVKYLGIEECFNEIYYDGKKPKGMHELLDQLLARGYKPEEILTVGDHPFNDLHPLHQLGGHTCLISKYEHADTTQWTIEVKSIEKLVEMLNSLNVNIKGKQGVVHYG